MVQYLVNVLRFDRLSGQKSGIERVRTVFNAVPGVRSKEKTDGVNCHESTKTWQEDMKERLGGWWW